MHKNRTATGLPAKPAGGACSAPRPPIWISGGWFAAGRAKNWDKRGERRDHLPLQPIPESTLLGLVGQPTHAN